MVTIILCVRDVTGGNWYVAGEVASVAVRHEAETDLGETAQLDALAELGPLAVTELRVIEP